MRRENAPSLVSFFLFPHPELRFLGSVYGAGVGTGAAIDALVGIDDVLAVSLGNGLGGTIGSAGAAVDASIADFVSHGSPP